MKIILPLIEQLEAFPMQYYKEIKSKAVKDYIVDNFSNICKIYSTDEKLAEDNDEIYFLNSIDEITKDNSVFLNPNFIFLTNLSILWIVEQFKKNISIIYDSEGYIIATKELSSLNNKQHLKIRHKVVLKLSGLESINLIKRESWWIVEKMIGQKHILFHPMSKNKMGMGHIYRGITIANHLCIDHKITFLLQENQTIGIEVLNQYSYECITYSSDPLAAIISIDPDIIVNDLLNTTKGYMNGLRKHNFRIINFEDMGEGAELADAVINDLYPGDVPSDNIFTGEKYYCMREDFKLIPRKVYKSTLEKVLITYGGEDPSFLTLKTLKGILKAIENLSINIEIDIILGPAFAYLIELENYITENKIFNVTILSNVKNMGTFIKNADLVFTSAGRTMYEIASIGVPAIVSAQNYRELTHTFGHTYNGFYNLGFGEILTEEDYTQVFEKLYNNSLLRESMYNKMAKLDFTKGIDRVKKIILGEFNDENK